NLHPNFAVATATGLTAGQTLYVQVAIFSPGATNRGSVTVDFSTPGELGACCLNGAGFPCAVMSENDCVQQGGTWVDGPGSTCALANCSAKGACHGVGLGCAVLSSTDCAALSGTYSGDGVPCP